MYPDFQVLFQSLFGTPMPDGLSILKVFGFCVALSFIGAAWATTSELRRKAKQGFFVPEMTTITVGERLTPTELLVSTITGFLLGFKIGGLYMYFSAISDNPMGYLFSVKGSLIGGLIGAVFLGGTKYVEKKKHELPKPEQKSVAIYPHDRMTEIVVVAALGGLGGAKIFNVFETWKESTKSTQALIESLTSSEGLTFLGGLIMATLLFYYFCRKHKIPFKHMCDAAAPGIMLAYGTGRLGCQLSGDGDWGIYNTAYISNTDGTLATAASATPTHAHQMLSMIQGAPQAFAEAPSWLPRWLFGMNYPHNVANEGMHIDGCTMAKYCNVLPVSVFPTPIYEAIVCVGLFLVLWKLRHRFTRPLQMFGTYLIMVGVERFLVELIRVNYKYDWGFIHPSQAEILSVALTLLGAGLLLFYRDKSPLPVVDNTPEKV